MINGLPHQEQSSWELAKMLQLAQEQLTATCKEIERMTLKETPA